MKINVDQIREDGLELEFDVPADTFDYLKKDEYGLRINTPVHVALLAKTSSAGVIIKGTIRGVAALTCSRCLKQFEQKLDHGFSYDCLPEGEAEHEIELSMEDVDICYYTGMELDTAPLIQEQVALAFPMRPLCKDDCKGLCPKCGADLNQGDCGCDKGAMGLPFAALKGLKVNK